MERKPSLPADKRRSCFSWETIGMCRLGASCRYTHDIEHAYVPPDYTHRRWSHAQASTSHTAQAIGHMTTSTFSVMSYNVLADKLARDHARELYIAVPEQCLDWNQRIIKLIRELMHWKPDIICLQEVDHAQDFTEPLESLGYAHEYAARSGGRTDGCLTLWRADKFKPVAWDRINMNEHGLRDNVGLIVILRLLTGSAPAKDDATIAIANTHLLFNPQRGDIKLGQAGLILRRMAAMFLDMGIQPLSIFTGDFNSTPQSAVYSFIRHGELDCFLEDRRMLSGQLESNKKWLPRSVVQRQYLSHSEKGERRGASLDDPSRAYSTGKVALATTAGPQHLVPLQHPAENGSSPGAQIDQRQFLGTLMHCNSSPQIAELSPVLQKARQSGPVTSPGQGPLYPYADEFGQIVWSHVPPASYADVKRQPFYHQPMVVEEAKPAPPPPTAGILRSLSFAKRQANATTWTHEQLVNATGYVPVGNSRSSSHDPFRQAIANANDVWIAEHPIPMRSTYDDVLGTEPAYTSCHSKFIGTVDYVWFTPRAGRHQLTPSKVLLPPPIESLHCGLPSPDWPSDHISLLAQFTLTSTTQEVDGKLHGIREEGSDALSSDCTGHISVAEESTPEEPLPEAAIPCLRAHTSKTVPQEGAELEPGQKRKSLEEAEREDIAPKSAFASSQHRSNPKMN